MPSLFYPCRFLTYFKDQDFRVLIYLSGGFPRNLKTMRPLSGMYYAFLKYIMETLSTFGFYKTKRAANRAIHILKKTGIKDTDISVLYPSHRHKEFTAHERRQIKNGALIGAFLGILIFGAIGFFINARFMQTEELPPEASVYGSYIVLKGIILGVLLGAGCGALVGMGTPKSVAVRYGDYVGRSGGVLVSVRLENPQEASKITQILEKTGANDIKSMEENETWKKVLKEKKMVTPKTSSFE